MMKFYTLSLLSLMFAVVASAVESNHAKKISSHLRKTTKSFKQVTDIAMKDMTKDCTMYLVERQLEGLKEDRHWECELDPEDNDGVKGHFVQLNVNFPLDYRDEETGAVLESGATTLHASEAFLEGNKAIVRGKPKLYSKKTKSKKKDGRRLTVSPIVGDRTVLVVRVDANDAQTTATEEDLAREIFGTTDSEGNTDSFNLSSAFKSCSHDKLTFSPYTSTSSSPTQLETNGVLTVDMSETAVIGLSEFVLKDLVLAKVQETFNNADGNLNSLFDHIMLCLPAGSGWGNWRAFGYVNHYITVFNDNRCLFPSAQVHEIGHNLGLLHSNENGNPYEDQTGLMGYSYPSDDAPVMCFNNAKHWQLGWFQDKHVTVNPLQQSFWEGSLVGYVDYGNADTSSVILRVVGHNKEYFVGFNRISGINGGNAEAGGGNKITIQSRGSENGQSDLEAKLGVGDNFDIANFGSESTDVRIEVEWIDFDSNPPRARVSVKKLSCTSDSDCNDDSSCTTDTCNINTGACLHLPNGQCEKSFMQMTLLTDKYPQETSWSVIDNCNGDEIVMSGGGYTTQFSTIEESGDFPPSMYTFEIDDVYGDGICCGQGSGSFSLTYNDGIIASGGNFGSVSRTTWGSCGESALAPPVLSPSKSPTARPSALPSLSPCEISYDVHIQNGGSGSITWQIENHETLNIVATSASNIGYPSGYTIDESGCLQQDCYRFRIHDAAGNGLGSGSYTVEIEGQEIVTAGAFQFSQTTLFGTCKND